MARAIGSRQRFNGSLVKCNDNSVRYWRKKTLGDKLHHLARLSPAHVTALERLVDQILRELKVKSRLMRFVICALALSAGS